jgi:Predicted dehydrogenase
MQIDLVVIGAGVVGLACGAEGAKKGLSTLIIEKHKSFGQETSSRNSEVIHSGIYYPKNSLKAKLCVRGNNNIYGECEKRDVWASKCGKLIVAVLPEEEEELLKLYNRGIENGVEGMKIVSKSMALEMEPEIRCYSAIFLPTTGIIDSHELMKSYVLEAKANFAETAFGVEFVSAERKGGIYRLKMKDSTGESIEIESRYVINSGGLHADRVASGFGIDVDSSGYRLHHNRGHYYQVSGSKSKLIRHLVYPLPHKHLVSIGVHITVDRAGQVKLGPDTEYLDWSVPENKWYIFDESRKENFTVRSKDIFRP